MQDGRDGVDYHLAQLNIARFRKPSEDPENSEFVGNLDRVNAIAEASPGFVWRLTGEGNDALSIQPYADPQMAVNMSVWEDVDSLAAFAYRNMDHRSIMRRRREWFEHIEIYMVLWWIPANTIPTIEDAIRRLDMLRRQGPGPEAFTFKQPFPPPGGEQVAPVEDECA